MVGLGWMEIVILAGVGLLMAIGLAIAIAFLAARTK
jgi:hypothetical protein